MSGVNPAIANSWSAGLVGLLVARGAAAIGVNRDTLPEGEGIRRGAGD